MRPDLDKHGACQTIMIPVLKIPQPTKIPTTELAIRDNLVNLQREMFYKFYQDMQVGSQKFFIR